MTTTITHDSHTCTLNSGQPCAMCAAANEYEARHPMELTRDEFIALARPVLERMREALREDEDDDCAFDQLSQAERAEMIDAAIDATTAEAQANGGYLLADFDDDWELAPLSRTRCVEKGDAEYWYRIGGQAKEREMLLRQNSDMRELLRTRKARME